MEKDKILGDIRLLGTEFKDVTDDRLQEWLEFTEGMLSETVFGKIYHQARALLVCHKMKMAGLGRNENGSIPETMNVTSYAEGSTNISYSANQANNLVADAEYTLTAYGIQLLNLRRGCIVPIAMHGPERE